SSGPTEDSLILRGGQQFGMRGTGEGILDHNARFPNVLQAALLVFLQAATQKITDQPWSLPGQCFERRLLHHDGSQNFRYVFTMASEVILMVAGFRSRCTTPFSWAPSSASVICTAIPSVSSTEI